MNLDIVKKMIIEEIGKTHYFCFKGIRNQTEKFNGTIKKCYPSIFIIETAEGTIKSFSYNDYIIENIKIIS